MEYNTSMGDHTMLAFAEVCHLYELALKQRHQLDQIVWDTFWSQMSPHGNTPSILHMHIKLSANCRFNVHIRSIVSHIYLSKEKKRNGACTSPNLEHDYTSKHTKRHIKVQFST